MRSVGTLWAYSLNAFFFNETGMATILRPGRYSEPHNKE